MPPFRLLHVAELDLDAVLPTQPWYSAELSQLCKQAPQAAAERIVEAAIAHDVDGVLLTPAAGRDEFPDVLSLAASELWQDFLDSLSELGIAVVIAVNSNCPPSTGLTKQDPQKQQGALGRDGGISVLKPGDRAPLYDRQGRFCAEFLGLQAESNTAGISTERPYVIRVAPAMSVADLSESAIDDCDYLALGTGPPGTSPLNDLLAHCPGSPQGRYREETGPHGVSLISVDEDGRLDLSFVTTASVRFEALDISADADAEIDDAALQAMEMLSEQRAETSEQGWLVSWSIQASGPLHERLNTRRGQQDFLTLLPEEHEGRLICHQVMAIPVSDDNGELFFAAVFQAALREKQDLLNTREGRASLVGVSTRTPAGRRIADLLPVCDAREVMDQARQYGHTLAIAATRDIEVGSRE